MLDFGNEQRRVRFASIVGIEREDLPLAAEVWQSDLCAQPWCKSEHIKLAMIFTQYMSEPNERLVTISALERTLLLEVERLREALRQLKMFGAVEGFTLQNGCLRVSLRLSVMQRLKVLEMRVRFLELSGISSMAALYERNPADQWQPMGSEMETEGCTSDGRASVNAEVVAA